MQGHFFERKAQLLLGFTLEWTKKVLFLQCEIYMHPASPFQLEKNRYAYFIQINFFQIATFLRTGVYRCINTQHIFQLGGVRILGNYVYMYNPQPIIVCEVITKDFWKIIIRVIILVNLQRKTTTID